MKLQTEEKFAFLQLSQYIAMIDGEYGPKEREVVNEYCIEMGIENIEIDKDTFSLDENLEIFTSKASQRIAMLTLMVLIHIDDKFGIYEHKTMSTIAQKFNLTDKEVHYFSMWGKARAALYEQALLLIQA